MSSISLLKEKKKVYADKCKWHSNYMTGRFCSSTWGKCPNDTPKDVSVGINVSKNSKMFCTLIEQSRYQERGENSHLTFRRRFLNLEAVFHLQIGSSYGKTSVHVAVGLGLLKPHEQGMFTLVQHCTDLWIISFYTYQSINCVLFDPLFLHMRRLKALRG